MWRSRVRTKVKKYREKYSGSSARVRRPGMCKGYYDTPASLFNIRRRLSKSILQGCVTSFVFFNIQRYTARTCLLCRTKKRLGDRQRQVQLLQLNSDNFYIFYLF